MPLVAWLVLMTSQVAFAMETVYQEPDDFIEQNLSGCHQQVLWLKSDTKTEIERLVERSFPGMRVRYCEKDGKTGWILNAIGKTEPITSGIIINDGRVEQVRVLIFRESRGSEVHRSVSFASTMTRRSKETDRWTASSTGLPVPPCRSAP